MEMAATGGSVDAVTVGFESVQIDTEKDDGVNASQAKNQTPTDATTQDITSTLFDQAISEALVQLEKFATIDYDALPSDPRELSSSTDAVQYEVILETARGLLKLIRTKGSGTLTLDHFEEVVSNCELQLRVLPKPSLAEQIRKLLVIIARPMSLLICEQEGENSESKPASTRSLYEPQWKLPKVISDIHDDYFGPAKLEDILPSVPLWFAGSHTAKECENILQDKVNGTFLIRNSESKPGNHNLTVRRDDKITNYRINRTHDGEFYLTEAHCFSTLSELVEFHREPLQIKGFVINLLFPVFSYASNPWYHGTKTKKEAEELLKDEEYGSFLVRSNLSGGYAMSVRMAGAIHHYRIMVEGGTYRLNKDVSFKSLVKLVKFYAKEEVVKGGPKFARSFARHNSSGLNLFLGRSYIYLDFVDLREQTATPIKANAQRQIGSGFGKSGLYQRRYMKKLEGSPNLAVDVNYLEAKST